MSARRLLLAPLAAVWLAAAGPALAGGSDIGEAGLKALDKGAYAQAIKLFTQALGASDLSDDDREFAFLCRAKAYLGQGDRQHALSDLKEAVQLKPDDAEAQSLLEHAFGRSAAAPVERAAASDGWGLFDTLAGNAYWYQSPGRDHTTYVTFTWVTQGQSLSEIIHDKRHVLAAIELVQDPQAHRILIAAQYEDGPHYGTAATARGPAVVERVFVGGKPITETLRLESGGAVQGVQTTFENGAWTQTAAYTLVHTDYDELVAAGLLKKKK